MQDNLEKKEKDLMKKILHDIRNLKKYDKEELKQMNDLSKERLLEIISAYNHMMIYCDIIIHDM